MEISNIEEFNPELTLQERARNDKIWVAILPLIHKQLKIGQENRSQEWQPEKTLQEVRNLKGNGLTKKILSQ